MQKILHLKNREESYEIVLEHKDIQYHLTIKTSTKREAQFHAEVLFESDEVILKTPQGQFVCTVARDEKGVWVSCQGFSEYFEIERKGVEEHKPSADNELRAPMTGRVVAVPAQTGQSVQAGELVVVLEAMKMEFRIEAPFGSHVTQVLCKPGDLVDLGQTLIVLESKSTD
jgi:acetyl/propionyl-CoA carboxylase alpha subunit